MKIASFDIGFKNFAFCIEECGVCTIDKVCYKPDGTIADACVETVRSVCRNGKLLLVVKEDLVEGKSKDLALACLNMSNLIDKHMDLLRRCNHFLIEKQCFFGRTCNPTAVSLAQHCYSHLVIRLGEEKLRQIQFFPAYHKTQILGMAKIKSTRKTKTGKIRFKSDTKPNRKKWAVHKAQSILSERGELKCISDHKKKDDIADVVLQAQAFKLLTFSNQ